MKSSNTSTWYRYYNTRTETYTTFRQKKMQKVDFSFEYLFQRIFIEFFLWKKYEKLYTFWMHGAHAWCAPFFECISMDKNLIVSTFITLCAFFGQTIGSCIARIAGMSWNVSKFNLHVSIVVQCTIQFLKIVAIYNGSAVRLRVTILLPIRHIIIYWLAQKVRISVDAQFRNTHSTSIVDSTSCTLDFTGIIGGTSADWFAYIATK